MAAAAACAFDEAVGAKPGVNVKALSTYMGHSSSTVTLDRYGHLMPGLEDEAAVMLTEYLEHLDIRPTKAKVTGSNSVWRVVVSLRPAGRPAPAPAASLQLVGISNTHRAVTLD